MDAGAVRVVAAGVAEVVGEGLGEGVVFIEGVEVVSLSWRVPEL